MSNTVSSGAAGSAGGPSSAPSDTSRLASGASVAVLGRMIGRGLSLASQVVVARVLGPAGFGLYAVGWTLLRLAGLFAPLGLDNAVIRFGSSFLPNDAAAFKSLLRRAITYATATGAVMGLAVFLGAEEIASAGFSKPVLAACLRWFAPAFVLTAVTRVLAATARTGLQMRRAALVDDIAQPAVLILAMVPMALLHRGLGGAAAATSLSFVVPVLLGWYYVLKTFPQLSHIPGVSRVPRGALLAYSASSSLAAAFGMLVVWMDRLIAARYLPAVDLGVYQGAAQLAVGMALVLSGFNAVVSPLASTLLAQAETRRLDELYRITTKWAAYLCVPGLLMAAFSSRALLTAVFGADYARGAPSLVILSVGQFVNATTGPVGILLIMGGRQGRWLLVSSAMLVLNTLLCIVLIPRFGLVGAAAAGSLAVTGLNVGGLLMVRASMGLWPYDRRSVKGLIALLCAAAAAFGTGRAVEPALLSVAATLVAGMAVFALVLKVAGFDDEDREFAALARGRLAALAGPRAVSNT